jgi:hypothetical protein
MQVTTRTSTARRSRDWGADEVRRLVGFEREYRCSAGHEHRSWARLRACPECDEPLTVAVIHRAALATAC